MGELTKEKAECEKAFKAAKVDTAEQSIKETRDLVDGYSKEVEELRVHMKNAVITQYHALIQRKTEDRLVSISRARKELARSYPPKIPLDEALKGAMGEVRQNLNDLGVDVGSLIGSSSNFIA
eukprot:6465389-Amphidinium_carterae.1